MAQDQSDLEALVRKRAGITPRLSYASLSSAKKGKRITDKYVTEKIPVIDVEHLA